MRYKIVLSYSGAAFCGWQRQPGAPSVQETLESALSTLLGGPVQVTGAGRTDTGVSAVGYVAHFDAPAGLDAAHIACKLNAILPASISVSGIAPAEDDFHARFDAVSRSYTYFLHRRKDPFATGWSYFFGYPEVDFGLMNEAAGLLLGTHDFSCFQKTGSDAKTSICTVTEAAWHPYTPSHVALLGGAEQAGVAAGRRATLGTVRGRGLYAHQSVRPGPGLFAEKSWRAQRPQGTFGGGAPATKVGGTPLGGSTPLLGSGSAPASSPLLSGQPGDGTASSPLLTGQPGGDYWYFRISADRFLRNMVRAIVGTLLEVGRGRRSAEAFASLLHTGPGGPSPQGTDAPSPLPPTPSPQGRSRRGMAGESAPGHALFLSGIEY